MTNQIELWAIRKVDTDMYLPARTNGRGYSHDEPQANGGKLGPRLFHNRHAARCALSAWLQGKWIVYHERYGPFGSDEAIGAQPKRVLHRNKIEMELVCFHLTEAILP